MKENRIILILILLLYITLSYGQNNLFELNGSISEQFNGKQIMLFAFDEDTILKVDTTIVSNGKFKFTGTESLKDIGILSVGNYPDTVASLTLFLDKGNITADIDSGRVTGTPYNNMYQGYLDTSARLYKEMLELKSDEDENKESKVGLYVKQGSPRHKKLVEIGEYTVGFKKQNIHNAVGQYLFEKEAGSLFGELYAYPASETCPDSAFYIIYNAADDNYKEKEWVQNHIKSLNRRVELARKEKQLIGKLYTDFFLKDQAGDNSNISDYIGKSDYILIDFWASWCGPCIASFPHLQSIYDRYERGKLEIIGVSLDYNTSTWIKTINREKISWVQLITESEEINQELMDAYSFKGIPYYVLLNHEGEIIGAGNFAETLTNLIE